MADSSTNYWQPVESQADGPEVQQSSIEQLARWAWELNAPALSVPDATRPAHGVQYPEYIDIPNDALYRSYSAKPMCPTEQAEGTSLTAVSDQQPVGADRVTEAAANAEATRARSELVSLAKAQIASPVELAKFEANMKAFEQRAASQSPLLPSQEICKTYQQIARLLQAHDKQTTSVTSEDRVHLAEQVMEQVAAPTSIDQGYHNTCTLTTIEARCYTRTPSEAARLVSDVATTGKYTAADGHTVELSQSSTIPADSEAQDNPTVDGKRSYASQLFQVTAVNFYWSQHEYQYADSNGSFKSVPPGKLRYEQREPDPGKPDDTGERLIDFSADPPAVVMDYSVNPPVPVSEPQTDLHDDAALKWMSDKISGKNDTIYIFHDGYENADGNGTVLFDSEKTLEQQIQEASEEGKLPIIMAVSTNKEPFLSDSGGNAAGGSGGWHVITITGYDPRAQVVSIDNQWGADADHAGSKGIRLQDLYHASFP